MQEKGTIEIRGFEEYGLSHASAETVFQWLKENREFGIFGDPSGELGKSLIERDEPLIKLGLALYANLSGETALRLFRTGNSTIKKAVLAGRSVGSGAGFMLLDSWVVTSGVLGELLESFDDNSLDLLRSFLSNQCIPDSLLVSLYKRNEPFEHLTDKQWLMSIGCTVSNPRLSTAHDRPIDVWGEMAYRQVFAKAWKLFEILPVDENSANLLSYLGRQLVPDGPHNMNVLTTIKRWEVENDESDSAFHRCRYLLAGLIENYGSKFQALKNSDDIALRQSYYRRFRGVKPEEVRELFEKDKDKFLDVALDNQNLYVNESVREELRRCCSDYRSANSISSRNYSDSFRERVARLTGEHPELFADSLGDIPFNAVKDPVLRANKRLEFLEGQMNTLSAKSENQVSLMKEVKTILSESNQKLSNQISKSMSLRWVWLIIGLLMGYILAKWL